LTHQHQVGQLVSPVTYGHLHFKFKITSMEKLFHQAIEDIDRAEKELGRYLPANQFAWRKAAVRRTHDSIHRIRGQWLREYDIMSSPSKKNKRQAAILAGAAALISSVFSLGMGVKNSDELQDLHRRTQNLERGHRELIVSINRVVEQITHKLNYAHSNLSTEQAKQNFLQTAQEWKNLLVQSHRSWLKAIYQMMNGNLDPALVSVEDLYHGLEKMTMQSAKRGLKPVPFENIYEVLFTLPISSLMEYGDVHIWVSVPLMETQMPTMSIVKLRHVPIRYKNSLVELKPELPYLATDNRHNLYAEISAEELSGCQRHRGYYFCDRNEFYHDLNSCSSALFVGDKKGALEHCDKIVTKAPAVVINANLTDGERYVELIVAKPTNVQRICPHGEALAAILVNDTARLALPYGCRVEAGGEVLILPQETSEMKIASDGGLWTIKELFPHPEELQALDMTVLKLNATKIRLPLELTPVKKKITHSSLMYFFIPLFLIVCIVAAELIYRYVYACRQLSRYSVPDAQSKNEEETTV